MFQLSVQDIHPGQQAGNKEEAIRQVAAALVSAGNVADGYVNGMLAREQQTSTFLGNGIAIPHGTTDTRDRAEDRRSGVSVPAGRHRAKGRPPMWRSGLPPAQMNTSACCVS